MRRVGCLKLRFTEIALTFQGDSALFRNQCL
jgi:hypothetical protein